jgi:hypothetical protein
VASLVTFAIFLSVAYGVLFGAFFAISWAIRSEDKRGPLGATAPSMTSRGARYVTGLHRVRWSPEPRPRVARR